jgi:hypothetical protein
MDTVWGRGAIDFKGGLAVFAQAVIDIARSKRKLARDIIFLAEADEEGGSYSTRWLAEKHWDKIDCEFALNEGGWIIKNDPGAVRYVSYLDRGQGQHLAAAAGARTSTHSSMPQPDNAIFILSRALAKISRTTPSRDLPNRRASFFLTLSETSDEPMRTHFRNLATSRDEALVAAADRAISRDTLLHAIMRNTDRTGSAECRIPRQRDSRVGRRDHQLPCGAGNHRRRINRRNETRDRRFARGSNRREYQQLTRADHAGTGPRPGCLNAGMPSRRDRVRSTDALVKHAGLTYPGSER